MLEHELAIRHLATFDALPVAEGREVRRPTHARVAVALDERDELALDCERAAILRAASFAWYGVWSKFSMSGS